jgi:3-oxoacyl-[acyl-carrier protein] reductase
MYEFDFHRKQVLVVGGSSGIGNSAAQAFRGKGANVHVTGTRQHKADYAETSSDMRGLGYSHLDVSQAGSVEAWVLPFDNLDVLVLAQGMVRFGGSELHLEVFRQVLEVNVVSVQACANKCRAMLAAAKGSLITISSAGAFRATPDLPAYAASKAGVVHLTRTLAQAWAGEGIRVNGVAPGLVATKMITTISGDPELLAQRLRGIPAGRLGAAEDIAAAILFLASPMASYIFGQTLLVDGGRTLA